MRLLFVGLGSIGRRHLNDAAAILTAGGIEFSADALRSSSAPLPPETAALIQNVYRDVAELSGVYDAAFICTPTSMHLENILELGEHARNLFIEKPVFDTLPETLPRPHFPGGHYYVACPLRFSKVIAAAKQYMAKTPVYLAQAVCSSYLPEWRPGTDYRNSYSARRELGGGVRLDLIHEWDYLYALFGRPIEVTGYSGKLSDLEIDSDDAAVFAARYADRLLTLRLDYLGRAPERALTLVSRDETVDFDLLNSLAFYRKAQQRVAIAQPEPVHVSEMRYFLKLVAEPQKVTNINPLETAVEVLRLALR